MPRDQHKIYRDQILRQLAAFASMKAKGFDYACRLYPDDIQFLEKNKDKSYEQVKIELSFKLERV